jgi:hypothetical protein
MAKEREEKDPRGKPRIFKKEEDLMNTFESYLEDAHKKDELPNIAGFVVFADIGRQTFYDYEDRYPYTYKKIMNKLENEALNCKSVSDTLRIFYMKNKCGYRDKVEQVNKNVEMNYEDYIKKVESEDEY